MKTNLLGAVLVVAFPVVGLADPIIEVVPTQYDFGEVAVGSQSTTIVTVSNSGGHDLGTSLRRWSWI